MSDLAAMLQDGPQLPNVMPREMRGEPLGQSNLLSRFLRSFGQPSLDALREGYEGKKTPQEVARTFLETGPVGPFGAVRIPRLGSALASRALDGEVVPPFRRQLEEAQGSRHWPASWFEGPGAVPRTEAALEDAIRHTREVDARAAWDAVVFPDGVRRMGDELRAAEGRAFQANPNAWHSYRDAKIAFLGGRKGRPLTEGELMWEGLDRAPGSAAPNASGLLNTYGRERFMIAGHPETGPVGPFGAVRVPNPTAPPSP